MDDHVVIVKNCYCNLHDLEYNLTLNIDFSLNLPLLSYEGIYLFVHIPYFINTNK